MEQLWYAFIPLFVALDGGGLLPIFWALTHHLKPEQRPKVVTEAVLTATGVTLVFLLASRAVFALMGLALSDIMIAGGLILIVLCLKDLLIPAADQEVRPTRFSSPGVVPLGVPLLAGPAVLTTVILVRDQHGWALTLLSLSLCMILVWGILRSSERVLRWVGETGAQAISKIFSLILTAYGVMLIRRGLELIP